MTTSIGGCTKDCTVDCGRCKGDPLGMLRRHIVRQLGFSRTAHGGIPFDRKDVWDQGYVEAKRAVMRVLDRKERAVTPPCAYMGCEHPADTHGPDGCTVPRMDYSERRFTSEGERLPPRMRPCDCPEWREQTVVPPRLPREVLAETPADAP